MLYMAASTYPKALALLTIFAAASLFAAEKAERPAAVPNGESFAISDYLVPGKTVIFSFVSDFSPPCPCEPCYQLGDPLQALHMAREDVVVVKVDINRTGQTKIDWNSPVALQYGLKRVPHFVVFGPEGELIAADNDSSTDSTGRDMVHAMLETLPAHNAERVASTPPPSG